MKTLSMIAYIVGSLLLLASCFVTDIALTWWVSGISVLFLVIGCILQFTSNKVQPSYVHHQNGRR